MTIHLGWPLPDTSMRPTRTAARKRAMCRPYSVLLPVGFAVTADVTADAVRSYRTLSPLPRLTPFGAWRGGLLSVALSLGLPPPAVSRHRVSVEPGLSSRATGFPTGFPICRRAVIQPSDPGLIYVVSVVFATSSRRAANRSLVSSSAKPSTLAGW